MSTGHVGDGNIHASILVPPGGDMAAAHRLSDSISRLAIELGGSTTGEHGVGLTKRQMLLEELGEGTVELMRSIKQLLDPLDLFNRTWL